MQVLRRTAPNEERVMPSLAEKNADSAAAETNLQKCAVKIASVMYMGLETTNLP